jgi:ABC transport system ATP-binding/permease protein
MARLLLSLKDVHMRFGSTPLLDDTEFALADDEKIALVGRNGSGKSTLLKIVAGLLEPESGERFVQPGTFIHYLPQEPDLGSHETVGAYVEAGLPPMGEVYRVQHYLRELGLEPEKTTATLSGGEARRAALARALAADPDVLLLDEPTNHLDLPAIEWLEKELGQTRAAIIVISHDRRFLQNLSNRTVWMDRGQARRLERGFAEFESWRDKILEEEETEQALLAQRIATEEHWMRYGVTARRKRNMRRVDLLANLRKQQKGYVGQQGRVRLAASRGDLSGKLVIEAEGLYKSFGDQKIVSGLDLLVLRGNRLAIVGRNGAGKTTLIRLLTGTLAPDEGTVKLGTNLHVVTLDQNRDSLKDDDSVADVITGGRGSSVTINGETRHVMTYMKDFLFRPEQARTPVSVLSGGERARLILARELARPSNLLILDEPTNDLDLETLDLLQEMLADYKGTVIVVSHDRDFLDRVASSVLMHEGEGRWTEYAGGYSDMVAQRGEGVVLKAVKATPREKREMQDDGQAARPKQKLSFKEKHALETLPAKMAALHSELVELENQLADGGLFARDPKAFERASLRHAKAVQDLSAAEEQWLNLEILRESLN